MTHIMHALILSGMNAPNDLIPNILNNYMFKN